MTKSEFAQNYLQTWTEPDTDRRRHIIESVWSPEGKMVVSSIGATLTGVDEIAAHIGRVYSEAIEQNGLILDYVQQIDNEDAVLLASVMTAPSGNIVGKGADVIFRNAEGRVTAVYMFMGIK